MAINDSSITFKGGTQVPSDFNLDELNIELGHLENPQLDGLQNIINLPTGDTANTYNGSDGYQNYHRLHPTDWFKLASNNPYGNDSRICSAEPGSIGYRFLDPNPATFNPATDLVKADGTPVVVADFAAARAAFGNLAYDFGTGQMWSYGDTFVRAANGPVGWGALSLGKTEHGFTGWRFPNKNQWMNIYNEDFGRAFNSPFSYAPLSRTSLQWTSTESIANVGWVIDANGIVTDFFAFLTNTNQSIYMRDFRNDILPAAS